MNNPNQPPNQPNPNPANMGQPNMGQPNMGQPNPQGMFQKNDLKWPFLLELDHF